VKPPFSMPSKRRGFLPSFVPRFMFAGDKTAYRKKQRKPVPGEVDYFIGQEGYPLNFDAGEHFFRLKTGFDYFPFPPMIASIQEFLPQFDMLIWHSMYRKAPVGPFLDWQPGLSGLAVPVANVQNQVSVPGLGKVA